MKLLNRDVRTKMFLILFGVFMWWIFSNIQLVGKYIGLFIGAVSPFIIGLIIAFILNMPMMFFQKTLFKSLKIREKYKRVLSLFLTIVAFLIFTFILILIVIPNLIEVGMELKDKFPSYVNTVNKYVKDSSILHSRLGQWVEKNNTEDFKNTAYSFIKGWLFDWIGSTYSIASSVFGGIISFFLGLIFALYFLMEKEELIKGIKKLLAIILPIKIFNKVLHIGSLTRKSFSDFIVAQSLESIILGTIFFISMLLLKFPYAAMISIVIAVSSFIPIIGSFIGLFVGIILIFVDSPKLAGLFIILFLALQQIESNIIYPRVVGKLSGLSPLLTLAAVTLGGSLMGVIGIVLFIPIFSVIQKILVEFMENAPKNLD